MIDEIKLKSVNDGLECSLLREEILDNCSKCSLRKICDNIDEARMERKEGETRNLEFKM